MGSFAEARKEQLSKWMGGPEGEALAQVFGDRQDELLLELKQAVKARFPGLYLENDTADALPHTGAERKMWRFPRENDASYAQRQHIAPLLWYWAGTESAMFNVFAPVDDTYTDPTETWIMVEVSEVSVMTNRHVPSTSSKLYVANSNPDEGGPVAAEEWYSAYAMVYDASDGEWTAGPDWGSWAWGDGHLWGSSMSAEEARYLIFQILTWKAVISYPVRLGLMLQGGDESFWGAGIQWGGGWSWGTTSTADTPYLEIGNVWGSHAAQGGWIDNAAPQTFLAWGDGVWKWGGFKNPLSLE